MLNRTDKLVAVASLVGVATLGFGLAGNALLFSFGVSLLIVFGYGVAYGANVTRPAIAVTLLIVLAGFWALFAGALTSHRPDEPLVLILGLPIGTAFFVFGLWPLGLIPSILHVVMFNRFILPKRNVEKLVERFGRWSPDQ